MKNESYILLIIFLSIIAIAPMVSYTYKCNYIILPENRISNIDGLRGYLAVGVFLHHFVITYYWHRSGQWLEPPQKFINNLGQTSVVMFFMITGYLFFHKILNRTFNVRTFFIRRFLRLSPLYYFIVVSMLSIVFYQQKFLLYEDSTALFKHILKWFLFLQTDINHYSHTINNIDITNITAGVTWTLIYEWFFYLTLPLLFFLFNKIKFLFYILFFNYYLLCNLSYLY